MEILILLIIIGFIAQALLRPRYTVVQSGPGCAGLAFIGIIVLLVLGAMGR